MLPRLIKKYLVFVHVNSSLFEGAGSHILKYYKYVLIVPIYLLSYQTYSSFLFKAGFHTYNNNTFVTFILNYLYKYTIPMLILIWIVNIMHTISLCIYYK